MRKEYKKGAERKPYTHSEDWESKRGVQVSLRIDKELLAYIDEIKGSRSRNCVIRELIRQAARI